MNPSLLLAFLFFPGLFANPAERLGGVDLPLKRSPYFVIAGEWELPRNGICRDLVVREGKAYIAAGKAGLLIVDVSDPENMELVGSFDTEGDAQQVCLNGDTALLTNGASGLQIFDVSDSTQPQRIGEVKAKGQMRHLVVSESYAYVSDEDQSEKHDLVVVNLSQPDGPKITHRLPETVRNYLEMVGGYLATSGALLRLDNPAVPIVVGAWINEIPGLPGWGDTAFGIEGHLGVAGRFTGVPGFGRISKDLIEIYDVSEPASPVLLGSDNLRIGDSVREIHFWHDYLVVAGDLEGGDAFGPALYLFEISDASAPQLAAISYRTGATTLALTERFIFTGGEAGINEWEKPEVIRALTIQFLTMRMTRTSNGMALVLEGPPGESIWVLESANLQDWEEVVSGRFSAEGDFVFEVEKSEGKARFYQALLDIW